MRFALLFMGLASAPQATDAQTAEYNRQWGKWMGDLAKREALVSAVAQG